MPTILRYFIYLITKERIIAISIIRDISPSGWHFLQMPI